MAANKRFGIKAQAAQMIRGFVKRSTPTRKGTKGTRAERSGENSQAAVPRDQERAEPPATLRRGSQELRRPSEAPQTFTERKRLFLSVGDEVSHLRYEQWGIGVVTETMTSSVPGGTCLARIRFQDGQLRCFNNDLDNESCCYYFGVRRYWNPTHGVEVLRSKFLALKG